MGGGGARRSVDETGPDRGGAFVERFYESALQRTPAVTENAKRGAE
jgi:hypothetical protein